ncbi:MAG: FAD-binding protein [Hellea sp.]|nr:FAD-binding protein [Hellea sp.]
MSLVDNSKPLNFSFDGKSFKGFEGDTLASALLRNNVRLVGRSFKYHRPRGIIGAGSEEPNALAEIHQDGVIEPNRRATMIKLFDGLAVKSQNGSPSLNFDILAINDLVSPFLSAGFYYKTFMWPRVFWEKVYEPAIRRAAGLGRLSTNPDPDSYDKGFLHCDTLIIGAGAAGLQAALIAGRAGARVILADEDFQMGGRLLSDPQLIDGICGQGWAEQTIAELHTLPNVRLLPRTTVYGQYDHGIYGALETRTDKIGAPGARQVLWRIYSQNAILAAGAIERPIAFANNDRPGIMLASAMRTYENRFGIDFGDYPVLTNNNSTKRNHAASRIDTRDAQWVSDTRGRKGLNSVSLNSGQNIETDWLGVSGGWNPNLHLTCHKRSRPKWDETKACFVPDINTLPENMQVIGAANGEFSTYEAFASAKSACASLGHKSGKPPKAEDTPLSINAFWHVKGKKRAWVDFQNDVTSKDITLAHQEGFSSVEHVKRYTTLGMATDQGRTSNVVGLAILADARGQSIPETGTTIFRPPYAPVPIGAFAGPHKGQHFKQTRLTPSHKYAAEQGAAFVETGYWKRAQWFARNGEQGWRDSVDREVITTRSSVGICDVSTLGKIDVQGRDAGAFLNKVYVNSFKLLKPGKCRYGLMLREDGIAMDDGTSARFSDTHYVMTTTTANAGLVYRHLEFARQCLFPDMDVHLISTTEQWAQYSVAGPNARKLLQKIVDQEYDISNEAFPYMACGKVTVCGGTRARLFRLSFSGELAYEIAVPTRYGDALIRAILEAGEEFGACMYGTEALGVMRIEKGHAAGNELNGTTTALHLGLGGFVSKKKDCIGKVLSQREGLVAEDGLRLVGFIAVDSKDQITNGAHFINIGDPKDAAHDQGYMSSVAYSPELGHYVGLGFIKGGDKRKGEEVMAVDFVRDNHINVRIVSPHFVDPDGDRLRV